MFEQRRSEMNGLGTAPLRGLWIRILLPSLWSSPIPFPPICSGSFDDLLEDMDDDGENDLTEHGIMGELDCRLADLDAAIVAAETVEDNINISCVIIMYSNSILTFVSIHAPRNMLTEVYSLGRRGRGCRSGAMDGV